MYNEPVPWEQVSAQLSARMDEPTALKYKEIIRQWDFQFRRRSFFSSRVASADILGELHKKAQAVADGRMTKAQARRLIREFFVGEGADALAALGFAPPKDAKGVAQLASIPRLELIVDTNVRMAQETGHYKKWESLKDVYPYGVWRVGYSKVHREAHLERDGKIYAFDHPIWRESPPGGEFNCHCRRELMTARELAASGKMPVPDNVPFQPSSLGFDPGANTWGDVPFGKDVPPAIKKEAKKNLRQDLAGDDMEPRTPRELIERNEAFLAVSEKFADRDARRMATSAEKRFAALEEDISRLESLPAGSKARQAIVESWRRQDEELVAGVRDATDDLKQRYEATVKMGEDAMERHDAIEGIADQEERTKAKREINREINTLYDQQTRLAYLEGKARWRMSIVADADPGDAVVDEVAREVRDSHGGLSLEEARAAANREMLLNRARMSGTMEPLYDAGSSRFGQPPEVFFDKMPPDDPDAVEKGAYYLHADKGEIHLDRRYGRWSSLPETATHEYGHWLDYHTRLDASSARRLEILPAAFVEAGKADVDDMLGTGRRDHPSGFELFRRFGTNGTYWWTELPRILFGKTAPELSQQERYMIMAHADTMQSITNGRYGFGHSMAYAMDRSNTGVEAFAETYLAINRKDSTFRLAYPRMWRYIKSVLNKMKE